MTDISFFLVLFTLLVTNTVFGECKITDTNEKFEVVCSSTETAKSSTTTAKKKKTEKRVKASFESQPDIVMNEEEKRIMETNNKLDGYQSKGKSEKKPLKAGKSR